MKLGKTVNIKLKAYPEMYRLMWDQVGAKTSKKIWFLIDGLLWDGLEESVTIITRINGIR